MIDLKDIHWRQPMPLKHMVPNGHLPATPEAAALWQFLVMAMQALDKVEKQVTLEGDDDQVVNLWQLAHSARKIFELPESGGLDAMFATPLIESARLECLRCQLPWNAKLTAWFDSAGVSYSIQDRNPDKTGH